MSTTRRAIPPRPAQTAQPAKSPWPIEGAETWDSLFRTWAEALLAKYEDFGGMISMLIGELIACAWRLRHVNYYELSSGGMSNRDWMRAHKHAQHAWSRAQIDFARWARLLLTEYRRRAKLGDPQAEARIAALLDLPTAPPPPDLTQAVSDKEERETPAASDASTDTLKSVPSDLAEARAGVWADLDAEYLVRGPEGFREADEAAETVGGGVLAGV
jgi:hypothetical protein